ncbi:MAG: ribbon-helix-helix domain-containing protein [Campylobacterota bacterium]|nr:ribbon-helix-helix domain-containing protein [Campylobacterota bacterium]
MISVRLEESIEKQLNVLAKDKHISKSKIVKEALFHYFNMLKSESKQKSPYELGSELFGNYSSGSDNLSTTYKSKLKEKIDAKNSHR